MNYLIVLCYCLWLTACEKYSSLQILDYSITLIPTQSGNYSLSLNIPNTSYDIPTIIYCWKKMTSIPLPKNQNCELIDDEVVYRCVEINYTMVNVEGNQISNVSVWEFTWSEL